MAALAPLYARIDSANSEIRVLTIHPARKESEEIYCDFVTCKLDDDPVYEALSYTWGGPAPAPGRQIILNKHHHFAVFENLHVALVKLRQASTPRTIWIDAGNDRDALEEKGMQLLLMKRVYEQASRVVVWLGDVGAGEGIAMHAVARPGIGFALRYKTWKKEREYSLGKGLLSTGVTFQAITGEWDHAAIEVGELAQLLDRPWWRRVWIVQEVVLARKAVVMCGPDEAAWEAFEKRMRSGVWGILGADELQPARHTDQGSVIAKYTFPDAEYRTLLALQEKWRSKSWDETWYSLLFTFRRYEATNAKDRIYAFLGLMSGVQEEPKIVPDYSASTTDVFTDVARSLLFAQENLLLFNLKREPDREGGRKTFAQSQAYSLLDQARFLDPDGLVVDGQGQTPRKSWVRLPHGWERRQDGSRFRFYNHVDGTWHDTSPLVNQPPVSPQHMHYWRHLPAGWTKTWDNVGNAEFVLDTDDTESNSSRPIPPEGLPSWAPDWTQWSSRDASPFPSLVCNAEAPRYWASGKGSKAQIDTCSHLSSDKKRLGLTGVAFDTIASLAHPWCPDLHLLPIHRLDNKILQSWEILAGTPVPHCPYTRPGPQYKTYGIDVYRFDAYWRTHIADYAGEQRAPEDMKSYFHTWCNREGWASRAPEPSTASKSTWQRIVQTPPTEQEILNDMCAHLVRMGYEEASVKFWRNRKPMAEWRDKYRALRKRIHGASVGRVMFVTEKGYIGLGPWNAKRGDVVGVLLGGCTPFLLREVAGEQSYTLVGEAYVHGIMSGELFDGKMGEPTLRTFDLV
ncbi:hypothetical protein ACEQ8H_003881 [Pleosporales sp. CAS-2024a]